MAWSNPKASFALVDTCLGMEYGVMIATFYSRVVGLTRDGKMVGTSTSRMGRRACP